jgi:hypothetical protein
MVGTIPELIHRRTGRGKTSQNRNIEGFSNYSWFGACNLYAYRYAQAHYE